MSLALASCSLYHRNVATNNLPLHAPSRLRFSRKRLPRLRQRITSTGSSPTATQAVCGYQDAAPGPKRSIEQFDFVVLGSGIAGLSFALKAAEYGRVAVVTKGDLTEGCTQYAQGGVCAVLDAFDSVERHVEDTMVAGAFLNDRR
jgi:hypothetical protein